MYANYFIQKLLHNVSSEQRLKILKALSDNFADVACHPVGTHPMQRLVEMVNMEEERDEIFKAIKDSIVHMAFHEKGNYVLILTLNSMKAERFNYIIEKLMPHFYKLSLD